MAEEECFSMSLDLRRIAVRRKADCSGGVDDIPTSEDIAFGLSDERGGSIRSFITFLFFQS
jgi:hypothetical protein